MIPARTRFREDAQECAALIERINAPVASTTGRKSRGMIADLGADSLDKVTIIFELEEEFGIQIEDTEEAAVVTVRDLVALIERKTGKQVVAQ